ncbi:MAG: hypothetical protein R8J85_09960 [Mariprofundales bacterium]
MTDYFTLLRQNQKEPKQTTDPRQDTDTPTVDDDALLIAEETLPSEQDPSLLQLEDELLCDEDEGETESISTEPVVPTTTEEEKQKTPAPATVETIPLAPIEAPDLEATQAKISVQNIIQNDTDEVATLIAQWLTAFAIIMHSIFHHCRLNKPIDIEPLQKHITNLLIWLERDALLINALELELETADLTQHPQLKQDDLLQLVMKSIMMLLYCLKTTGELKSPHETRVRLVTASALQHIGMAQISPDILNKTGRLSPDELAEIRSAPSKGMAYLSSCNIEDEYILRGADESNERVDGSGARGLQGKDICYSARLIGLLSMFEAMIQVRSYRKRMLPREAVRVIVQKFKPAFEITMLKALLDAISLYPVGSFVKLNSKEIGKVITCHPRLPLRPIVCITMDEYGDEIPSRNIDLKKHPNLMIEQCAYEDDIQTLMHKEAA